MKKILLFLILFCSFLFGADGYSVYKKNCISCHLETRDDRAAVNKIVAPAMYIVYIRLKNSILHSEDEEDVNRHLFILFAKDYIMNPNLEYALCDPSMIEKYGLMPSQKGKLTDDEVTAVSEWLYDRYEAGNY